MSNDWDIYDIPGSIRRIEGSGTVDRTRLVWWTPPQRPAQAPATYRFQLADRFVDVPIADTVWTGPALGGVMRVRSKEIARKHGLPASFIDPHASSDCPLPASTMPPAPSPALAGAPIGSETDPGESGEGSAEFPELGDVEARKPPESPAPPDVPIGPMADLSRRSKRGPDSRETKAEADEQRGLLDPEEGRK